MRVLSNMSDYVIDHGDESIVRKVIDSGVIKFNTYYTKELIVKGMIDTAIHVMNTIPLPRKDFIDARFMLALAQLDAKHIEDNLEILRNNVSIEKVHLYVLFSNHDFERAIEILRILLTYFNISRTSILTSYVTELNIPTEHKIRILEMFISFNILPGIYTIMEV
jgi:hypothetical protein